MEANNLLIEVLTELCNKGLRFIQALEVLNIGNDFNEDPRATLKRCYSKYQSKISETLLFKIDVFLGNDLTDLERIEKYWKSSESFKDKFNKRVYFEYNNVCKIGVLIGLSPQSPIDYYIIKTDSGIIRVPCYESLSLL